jgi:molybdate transport system substrate-binding protein
VLAGAAALLGACGGDDAELVVSAASSLQKPLTECTESDDVKLQFAGSDELAAQIRRGVKPDVYAAASTELPEQLAKEGLLEDVTVFATNRLVVAVAKGSRVRVLDDLADDGVRIAIGSKGAPIGDYTRALIGRLGERRALAIRANIRSEEPDAKGIVGKLEQGAVDAGFVYVTDARAARLETIPLARALQPGIEYGAGIVQDGDAATAFLASLTIGPCQDALREAGFGAPRG